jgi:DNA-binding response OmpR family regulator
MTTGSTPKVMLVEDDATMQAVLRTLLEIEGFTVISAADKRTEADLISTIRQEKPDSILLDVHLRNNISGVDLCKKLRAEGDIGATRVIMTSGMDMQDQCMKAGANSFIMKPFMPDELIKKLRG